jgi:metallo-beta-lactamase class B
VIGCPSVGRKYKGIIDEVDNRCRDHDLGGIAVTRRFAVRLGAGRITEAGDDAGASESGDGGRSPAVPENSKDRNEVGRGGRANEDRWSDVLLNTAMQDSGPMIESSIRKLGFDPQNIGWLLTGHAHVDHVGGHAYIKQLTGARVAVAREEVTLLESGGKGDFNYDRVPGFDFAPVKVDRVLRDGDVIKLGNIALTAHVTPGHNLGAITWTMEFADGDSLYNVVFPDGSGVNPGFRVARNPSYPGIEGDYRQTLHVLESLKPDIWLHSHTDTMGFAAKAARARTEGVRAWVDPEGYRKWVASERAKFEDEVSAEISAVSVTNAP